MRQVQCPHCTAFRVYNWADDYRSFKRAGLVLLLLSPLVLPLIGLFLWAFGWFPMWAGRPCPGAEPCRCNVCGYAWDNQALHA